MREVKARRRCRMKEVSKKGLGKARRGKNDLDKGQE
jgi:hypothetical protein